MKSIVTYCEIVVLMGKEVIRFPGLNYLAASALYERWLPDNVWRITALRAEYSCFFCHGTGKLGKEKCPKCAGKGVIMASDLPQPVAELQASLF